MHTNKPLWSSPWSYRESFLFITGILITGFLLQLFIGPFNFFLLHQPVNYLVTLIIFSIGFFLAVTKKKKLSKWISGIPLAIAIISGMLLLTLLMGIIPQANSATNSNAPFGRLGLTAITSCWPFVLLYLFLLLSLCSICVKRVKTPLRKNLFFLLNHGGLWIALLAAGLGSADIQQHVMHVPEGKVEWRVYDNNGEVLELPIAIRLHDFDIEEYPPKMVIIDSETGTPQPKGNAEWLQIDAKYPTGKLGQWNITVNEYIHQAVWAGNNTYREMPMIGASPAANITARHKKTGTKFEGWISSGNMNQFRSALPLEENQIVVMAQPEPKRFVSDISVTTQDGKKERTTLEVNSPLRIGSWIIYQYGYDTAAGKLSSYSSFELVYDPWLPAVYAGLLLMFFGAIALIWSGKQKKREIQ